MVKALATPMEAHDYQGWSGDVGLHAGMDSSSYCKGTQLSATVLYADAFALEIGTAYGIGPLFIPGAMAALGDNGRLTTIESSEPAATIGANLIRRHYRDRGDCPKGSSYEIVPNLLAEGATFDLVFHDGGHSRDAYVRDFTAMEPGLLPGAVVRFDDIQWDFACFH